MMPCLVNHCSCYRSTGAVYSTRQGRLLEVRAIARKLNDSGIVSEALWYLAYIRQTHAYSYVFKKYTGKAHKKCF